ncbi:MAG: hypothetical protein MZV70_66695 [Desulfobacterales bacterium]|nr:hypothetical protein [Desulfobacterales bacterium]
MRTTLDEYARAGINTLIMLVKDTSGHVYYAERDRRPRPGLELGLLRGLPGRGQEAEDGGPSVVLRLPRIGPPRPGPPASRVAHPEPEGRDGRRGQPGPAGRPGLRDRASCSRSSRKYDVGWVHLDYIRYPCEPTEPFFSFDAETLRLFKAGHGDRHGRGQGPRHGQPGLERVAALEHRPGDRLRPRAQGRPSRRRAGRSRSAPPSSRTPSTPGWPSARTGPAWAREGLVDMLNPMLYTNDVRLYEKLAREAVGLRQGRTLVCPGIGIGTSHNQNTPEGMIEEMRITKSSRRATASSTSRPRASTTPFLDALKASKSLGSS